ncbi:DUF6183 family protein [Streptomyces sp. NPDC047108]|uniref:DUF6183 family protein n=1 Tax=Streptomyces sp. NPDC047108 TaxID=3155025 RepID=UPI0033EE9E89
MNDHPPSRDGEPPHRDLPELPEVPDAARLKELAASQPRQLYVLAEQWCGDGAVSAVGVAAALRAVRRIAVALAATRSSECAQLAADITGDLLPSGMQGRDDADEVRRAVATELARTQHLTDLEPLFTHLPEETGAWALEVRACILGELALIGAGSGRPTLDAYAQRLRELDHALAWLPRNRLDIEHRFTVRVRGLSPVKTPAQLRARLPEVPPTARGAEAGRAAHEVPAAGLAHAACAPFRAGGWSREPEARFFSLPRPIGAADFGISFIKALPLASMEGEGRRRGEAIACRTTADDVLNALFSAAYHGGVDGHPQHGAYARLHAWRSLYALMDLPAETPFLDAAGQAADHRWLRWMAFTDWFHHDTSDLAFAVLDPSRSRAAVLAATDTE